MSKASSMTMKPMRSHRSRSSGAGGLCDVRMPLQPISFSISSCLSIALVLTAAPRHPRSWWLHTPSIFKGLPLRKNPFLLSKINEIRSFIFDSKKGFFLNGKPLKILGVCNHHDLGCLGAAVSTRAIERQLEILKDMGCNGIRTSHNPPCLLYTSDAADE